MRACRLRLISLVLLSRRRYSNSPIRVLVGSACTTHSRCVGAAVFEQGQRDARSAHSGRRASPAYSNAKPRSARRSPARAYRMHR